jgi:hypothetical protein
VFLHGIEQGLWNAHVEICRRWLKLQLDARKVGGIDEILGLFVCAQSRKFFHSSQSRRMARALIRSFDL